MMERIVYFFEDFNQITICIRLILAALCGGMIGLSRSAKRRGAGFKTHALVCIGSALVMLTGQYIYVTFGQVADMSRLPAQVVSGVGFLGVGTIIVTGKNQIRGLTTAAGLWTCAGIGISVGIGFYSAAIITTILILLIYKFFGRVDEFAYENSKYLDLYCEFIDRHAMTQFINDVKEHNYKVMQMDPDEIKNKKRKDTLVTATIVLKMPVKESHEKAVAVLSAIEGVVYIEEI